MQSLAPAAARLAYLRRAFEQTYSSLLERDAEWELAPAIREPARRCEAALRRGD